MKRFLLALLALSLLACGKTAQHPTTDPSSLVEEMLLSETLRHASTLKVNVRGEITDKLLVSQSAPGAPLPTGWYDAGVAYYYRPEVKRNVSLTPEPYKETATNVAGHETCHALHFHHDVKHWNCMNTIAQPTYPHPATGVIVGDCF